MEETTYAILKVLLDFAVEVWFSISSCLDSVFYMYKLVIYRFTVKKEFCICVQVAVKYKQLI